MPRPTIALCLIAKNEEENIERLFKSVEGCFDEIHLTDTGSTDKTVELAKQLGATTHHFDWISDFGAARNYSFSHAKTDYVAWLDLDDELDSKENFIKWRDEVMHLADYWVATYHYSHDATGNPVCSFMRERVFKREKGFKWKYPIHEGVTHDSGHNKNIAIQGVHSWVVRHRRTEEDLKKDKERNLKIFELHKAKGPLDARMKYYYGKELFEAGKPVPAITNFEQALCDEKLEVHDRVIAHQYLCYAYMQCNQFPQAVQMAHQGIQLMPNRAEFQCIIADCYLKMNRFVDAIPYFYAAKSSQVLSSNMLAGVIFNNKECYHDYPRNQLARVFSNMGNFDQALKELEDIGNPTEETKTIIAEINRVKGLAYGYQQAKDSNEIVFTCMPSPYEWDGKVYREKSMGGSETACIEMAEKLSELSGRKTIVFNGRKETLKINGVEYVPGEKMQEYFSQNKPYLHIAWRHNFKLTDAKTFVWSHDLQTMGVENVNQYDKVLCLTEFHKRYMNITQGVPFEKIHVTRNGLNPDKFKGDWPEKEPYRFVFGSSPDRGLERCMRVLDKVREVYPQVTLHVHYGVEHLHKYGLQAMADKLTTMMKERPWVTYHGATEQMKLMDSYKRSAYNVQPSDFIETSCVTAMELLACGIYPIFRKVGGVVDTLAQAEQKGMCSLIDSECITELEYQKYVDATLAAISEEKYKHVKIDPSELSWEKVAKEWLEELPKLCQIP